MLRGLLAMRILPIQYSISLHHNHSTTKLTDNLGALYQTGKRSEIEEEIRIFGVTAVEKLRNEESNFQQSRSKIISIVSATEANVLGKSAWKEGRLWTAELAWTKALELGDKPHIRTNRCKPEITVPPYSFDLRLRWLSNR